MGFWRGLEDSTAGQGARRAALQGYGDTVGSWDFWKGLGNFVRVWEA